MNRHLSWAPLLALGLYATTATAQEATIAVTTFDDGVEDDGLCTLREAISSAQAEEGLNGCAISGSGDIVVQLQEGTYLLESQIEVKSAVTVRGEGAASTRIDAQGLSRIFRVIQAGALTVESVTLTGGNAGTENGGAIFSATSLVVRDSILENNTAYRAGAVYILSSALDMRGSTVRGNNATVVAGAIEIAGGASAGGIIESSTLADNTAGTAGGMYNAGVTSLRQVTVSGNTALGDGPGSAIYHQTGELSLDSVAVVFTEGGTSAFFNNSSTSLVQIHNSVIAGNSQFSDNRIVSHGFNLFQGRFINFTPEPTDITVPGSEQADLGLDPLALYGGTTPVHRVRWDSPLVGKGSCLDIDEEFREFDQRGAPLPESGCDIGPVQSGAFGVLTTVQLASAEQCPYGGVVFSIGEDSGHGGGVKYDGHLSPGEIEREVISCDGLNVLVRVIDEPEGENCPAGGKRIETGRDFNRDGILGDDEVEETEYVCNGLPGAPILVESVGLAPGVQCPAGGHILYTGHDLNRNGVLDEDEVESDTLLCNGVDGADGEDGRDGADGKDGADGADGEDGRDGVDGADGKDGKDGIDGKDGADGKDGRDGIDGQDAEGGCSSTGVNVLALAGLLMLRWRKSLGRLNAGA